MQTLVLALGIFSSVMAYAQSVTKIESFSPTGPVSTPAQVHVLFSELMFPLGEQNHPDPFQSNCEAQGKGRWLNPKEWVFEFKSALPANSSCQYTLRKGLKSAKGFPVIDPPRYEFNVVAAELLSTIPYGITDEKDIRTPERYYTGISPDQVFVLQFDRAVSPREVEDRITLQVEGRKEPIAVKALPKSVLNLLRKEARQGIYDDSNRTVAVEPALKFSNDDHTVVTLHDKNSSRPLYYRIQQAFQANFSCTRENANAPCSPLIGASLSFNSPVAVEELKKIKAVPIVKKGGASLPAHLNESAGQIESHASAVTFEEPLRAGTTYRIELPSGLKDLQGRSLSNAKSFPLEFKTDTLPAVVKFPTGFGVVEADYPFVPLSIRNLGKSIEVKSSEMSDFKSPENAGSILHWLSRVEKQENRYVLEENRSKEEDGKAANYESVFSAYANEVKHEIKHAVLPTIGERNEAEVIGIPLTGRGLHIVEVQSRILGKKLLDRETPLFTSSAVLMTNLGVHFKWGQDGPSLVWVTELSTGKPVSGAQIDIQSCSGATVAKGETTSDGTLVIQELPSTGEIYKRYHCSYSGYRNTHLIVMAKKADDFSFTLDSWKQGIEGWRYNLSYGNSSKVASHTIFARDLLKPGQKVQMKHYFREFHWQGFTVPKQRPGYVVIRFNGNDDLWSLPVKFDEQGIATSEWKLPDTAHLGSYSVYLSFQKPGKSDTNWISTGSFDVQEFRLPSLNVTMKSPDPITQDTQNPQLSIQGTYISGGAASQLPVELRFLRKEIASHSRVVDNFLFSQDKPVVTGIRDQQSEEYNPASENEGEGEEGASTTAKASSAEATGLQGSKLAVKANLDQAGAAQVNFPKEVLNADQDAEVMVGLNYPDPNGEIHTLHRLVSVFSRTRYLGVDTKSPTTFDSPQNIAVKFKLGNAKGVGVENEKIEVNLYQSIDYVHRIRLVGGFYGYHTTTEVKKIGTFCEVKTDTSGIVNCVGNTAGPGSYMLEAKSHDSKGRDLVYVQHIQVWGPGSDSASYTENDRLTLVPTKEEYDPNDTIRVAVLGSFKDFSALVTLERGGVMEHFVQTLSGDRPEITLPAKMQYSPNLVLSVFAVRGRLGEPAATGLVDLAKPAFKLGMTSIKVGIKAHELPLQIKTDKVVYQVRANAHVKIETKPNAEIALAVVDQALLKLKPNFSFDLLNSMMISQNHRVETSTLQMNIIGKRHFGKKANPFGGGGGKMITRELLDSLVAWKPHLKADASGSIETDFKLNDSISSFTVIAVGSEGLNYYGTAKTEISVTQDLQILSSVPPTLREQDQIPLQFILRNTTLKPLHVKARLSWANQEEKEQSIAVPSQSSREIKWDIQVPLLLKSLPIQVTAIADEGPKDALKFSSAVVEVLPVRVVEGYLEQVTGSPQATDVTFPKNALTTKGGFRIQLQSRLSEIPDSVNAYLREYPYGCLEQQTSKAIGLQDPVAFKKVVAALKTYFDSNSLLKFFPNMRYGSLDLSSYFLTIASEASKVNPAFKLPDTADIQRAIEGVRKGMRGQILVSETWWPAYASIDQRLAAGNALAHYEEIAVADYEALKSIRKRNDVNHLLALIQILDLSPRTLANSKVDRELYTSELLGQFQFENTRILLKDAKFWYFGSLSDSPDALRARTLLSFLQNNQKDNAVKLIRAQLEGMHSGYFDTTPGNAWSVVSLKAFEKKYEDQKVSGVFKAQLGSVSEQTVISEKKPKAQVFIPISKVGALGEHAKVNTSFSGHGKPWSFTFVEAALPISSPVVHGFEIQKEIVLIQNAHPKDSTRGDIYEVRLSIKSTAPQTWDVLVDPLPTGASILSTENTSGANVAFEERRLDRMQVFFEYLPEGKTEFRYRVRLNQAGAFELPPTRIEAMYDPTQYGEVPNANLKVNP